MTDRLISDLYVQNGADDLELRDGVTEACLLVHMDGTSHIWLKSDDIAELRDWCTEWLELHGTLTIRGAECAAQVRILREMADEIGDGTTIDEYWSGRLRARADLIEGAE